jgi:hypothetical protein
MIPYDDLVAALAAWRTRQGLPVGQSAASAPPSRGRAAPAPPAAPAPRAPAARPTTARGAGVPVQVASGDFDDAALVEDAGYDTGEDYVMQLGSEPAEPTAIGTAPEPPPTRGKRPW